MVRKRPQRRLRESYLIVTEGSVTEVEYFGLFQQLIRDNRAVTLKIGGCGLFIGHYRLKPLDDAPQSLNHRT
ncbi:hypothetical protein QP117_08565, partial [Actinotignum timonense]|uniref:hypothetical protein n=1 Tax=Actinotignum timonense TaxID=1870995 RepID=UPI00254DFC22